MTNLTTKQNKAKERKYKPVPFCSNCLRETKDCDCPSKLTHVVDCCGNCKEPLEECWSFCPVCGYEVNEEEL